MEADRLDPGKDENPDLGNRSRGCRVTNYRIPRGAIVQSPFADSRHSRFLFSRLDGVHRERTNAHAHRPLDCSSGPVKTVHRSGAADLFVPHDHLHVRDLDSFLSKLICTNQPGLQTKRKT